MTDWPEANQPAPAFTLRSHNGNTVSLSDYRGSPVVLYFYPRDFTSGCTKEACAFRDARAELQQAGAVLLGVSTDSVETHERFAEKHRLHFPLLADVDHAVAEQYGAWREKNNHGKKSLGIQRSTFLIDRDGKVAKVWKRVKVAGHDRQVLEALRGLVPS